MCNILLIYPYLVTLQKAAYVYLLHILICYKKIIERIHIHNDKINAITKKQHFILSFP